MISLLGRSQNPEVTMKGAAIIFSLLTVGVSAPSSACSPETGSPTQRVFVSVGDQRIELIHEVELGKIYEVEVGGNRKVGFQLDTPAPAEISNGIADRRFVPEYLKITTYKFEGGHPVRQAHTFGGASSLQSYGALGYKGEPLRLFLMKQYCLPEKSVASQ